ncbi:MAG: serine protease [Gemmatimonadaceae bacterium]
MSIKSVSGAHIRGLNEREEGSVASIVRSYSVGLVGRTRPTQGSGFVWRHDGVIITTAHAAKDSRLAVTLYDGRTVDGRVVARDRLSDLAIVQVQARGLFIAPMGDPWALKTGSIILSIEHARDAAGQLSLGFVHGVTRDGDNDPVWLATDMRLALRDMGAPLVDTSARVLGVNSATVNGLTAAIPSNVVTEFVREAEDDGLIPKREQLAA